MIANFSRGAPTNLAAIVEKAKILGKTVENLKIAKNYVKVLPTRRRLRFGVCILGLPRKASPPSFCMVCIASYLIGKALFLSIR